MHEGRDQTSVLLSVVYNLRLRVQIFQRKRLSIKVELPQVGIFFFHTQFPSLGIFINKIVGNRKN